MTIIFFLLAFVVECSARSKPSQWLPLLPRYGAENNACDVFDFRLIQKQLAESMSRKTKLHASHIALDCSVGSHSTQARQHHCEHYPTQVFVSCGKDASSSVNITWVTSSGAAASTVLVPVVDLCTTTTVCHVGRHPCDNPLFVYVTT